MRNGKATKCLTCGAEPVEPDHGGIRTCPHSHFQAADRPADPSEQALMDEYRRCAIRLNELLRSAPSAARADQLIGPCSRADLERNGQIRKELKRDLRHLERRRYEGTAVDADYNAELRNMLEVSDAFDAYCRSALAVTEQMIGPLINTEEHRRG
jgi:hypothetical protein